MKPSAARRVELCGDDEALSESRVTTPLGHVSPREAISSKHLILPTQPKAAMCSRTRAATMASYAVALLLRGVPLLRARALGAVVVALPRRFASSLSSSDDTASPLASSSANESDPKGPSQLSTEGTVFSRWKEEEILMDIEPVRTLAKEILHSKRYMDGECLSVEDEKVIEKLLHYHPHSEDKIGCGIAAIVVNRHTEFRCSRCFFIVRTDGDLMDFSYKKCLEAYIRDKYPLYAGNFIAKHFKRR